MSSSEIPSEEQKVKSEGSKSVEEIPVNEIEDYVAVEAEEDLCDSSHLLIKNTKSFKCLAQVILSNSSVLRHPLYFFPPLIDPGIDDIFNHLELPPMYDDIGVEKYIDMCHELDVIPISRVIRSLEEDTLNLKYYGLTNNQMKALTEALAINAYVRNLILEDNFFNPKVTAMISSMIRRNKTITVLNLKECRIGEKGAEKLVDAIAASEHLVELDLSYNELGDKGLSKLKEGLSDTISLKKLNLTRNNLTEESGLTLQQIFRENTTIEDLNLSWNQFNTGLGNKKLFNGITFNNRIKVLNLSWNGIGVKPAVAPIMRYLKKSERIEHLNLSNNRLTGASLKSARIGISKNHSLKTVKIGNNIYKPQEAYTVAFLLISKPTDPLTVLDMENMYFQRNILPVLQKIKEMGKTIKIGGILGNYVIKGPNIDKVLFERCQFILHKPKKKRAKKDFGHFILALPKRNMTREAFDELLKKKKMTKLDIDLINGIVERYPARKHKINVAQLSKVFLEMYPDTHLPPPRSKRRRGKKNKMAQPVAVQNVETGQEEQVIPTDEGTQDTEGKCRVITEKVLEETPVAEEQKITENEGTPEESNTKPILEQPATEAIPEQQAV